MHYMPHGVDQETRLKIIAEAIDNIHFCETPNIQLTEITIVGCFLCECDLYTPELNHYTNHGLCLINDS